LSNGSYEKVTFFSEWKISKAARGHGEDGNEGDKEKEPTDLKSSDYAAVTAVC